MDKSRIRYLIVSVVLAALAGCGGQVQVEPSEQLCMESVRKVQLMEICEDILARMQFVIEKYDIEDGFIKTRPLSGAQAFEFWRSDNADLFNAAESNIHSIQRSVTINILESEDQLCVNCDVLVQRLSLPEQKIKSTAETPGTFTQSSRSLQRLKLQAEQKRNMTWMDMGTDPALENKVLGLLRDKINKL